MHGDLSDTTVPAICRSLASQSATGRLTLSGPDGPGMITLSAGAITDASSPLARGRLRERLTGGGHLDELTVARVVHELPHAAPPSDHSMATATDDAALARGLLDRALGDRALMDRMLIAPVVDTLVELFARRGGPYRFETAAPEGHATSASGVHLEVERALVQVMQRSDELAGLPAVARSPDTVPLLLLDLPATPMDLDADALTVLTAIDDHRTLDEIARRIGYGMFDVAEVIARLYERGIVALTQPQVALPTRATPPADPVPLSTGPTSAAGHAHGDTHTPATAPADTAGSQPAQPLDPAGATDGAVPRRSDPTGDTDVSEFLRELSSLANRDDARSRRATSPAQTGRRDRPDAQTAGVGDDPSGPAGADDDADADDEHRRPGSATSSDEGRRRRRGLFGRG